MRSPRSATREQPLLPTARDKPAQHEDPAQPEINTQAPQDTQGVETVSALLEYRLNFTVSQNSMETVADYFWGFQNHCKW